MKKLLLVCVCGAFLSSAALAADPYEKYLTKQSQRGAEIELIRVASEKPLVETDETDAEVAEILEEAEALEAETTDHEDADEAS